tara:strand:- start:44 stop:295 length:252 start_codon:yes stop_codon:yes gene_type:complete
METIQLDDFLHDGIIKESIFRKKIENFNWKKYTGEKVLIKGCSQSPVPTWAYMIIAGKLMQFANSIYFGESCSAVKIYKKPID